MSEEIKEMISRLGVVYVAGSSSVKGHVYGPIPFEGYSDIPVQREEASWNRWDIIKGLTDFKDKVCWDFGCANGFFSFMMAKEGAKDVLGVDHDVHVILLAKMLESENKIYNTHFIEDGPDFFLDQKYDIGLAFSVLMWLGKDKAEKFLLQASKCTNVVYFDMGIGRDGMSGADWVENDDDIVKWVKMNSKFTNVFKVGATKGMGNNIRSLFRCDRRKQFEVVEDAEKVAEGNEATVYRKGKKCYWFGNGVHKKHDSSIGWELCKRAMSTHFPYIYRISKVKNCTLVEMEWINGGKVTSWNDEQAQSILRDLKAANIMHRDIQPYHLLKDDRGNWKLIDFGWACPIDNPYPAPFDLGGPYRDITGPNDYRSMTKIRKEMVK